MLDSPLTYPVPADEEARLQSLAEYGLMDTPPEADFDSLAALASRVLDAPIALISFVARDRQYFKAKVGANLCETSREASFCAHALTGPNLLVVPDATQDGRFAANPAVVNAPHIRFYAGAPLASHSGHVLGTLCVIDVKPRLDFNEARQETLRDIAALVVRQMELRRLRLTAGDAYTRFWNIASTVSDAVICTDGLGNINFWNPEAERLFGYSAAEARGRPLDSIIPFNAARKKSASVVDEVFRRRDGEPVSIQISETGWNEDGQWCLGIVARNVSKMKQSEAALAESERRFGVLVNGVTDYALYTLDSSGIVTNWNSGAQLIKGYSASEIVGRHFSCFFSKEDRAAGLPTQHLDIAKRAGRFETEGWRVRKDGSRFWAAVVIDAIHNDDGTLLGFAKITRDVSEKRQAEEAIRESERQFRLLVSGVHDHALYMLDPNGIVTSWNAGAERIKGYSAKEIIGRHFSTFYTEAERIAGVPARSLHIAAEHGRFETEAQRVRKDGSLFWANVVIEAIRDEAGGLVGFAKITRDITERRRNDERLYRIAHFDMLTNLLNRFALQTRLNALLDAEETVTVLMLDLDGFKEVNATFGHTAGDFVLKGAADRIRDSVGDMGIVGRLGGDEFAVIFPGLAEPIVAAERCQRLINELHAEFVWEETEIHLGLSIGMAIGPNHGTSVDELFANADIALYRAKSNGRNSYCLFQPVFRNEAQAFKKCERELRRAVAGGELELFYQPLVHLADRRVIGAEALMRWRHPEQGILSPGAFLHVLDRGPLAATVGDWTIGVACAHAAAVRKLGAETFCVSVNLFGAQFRNGQLVATVMKALEANRLPTDAIELEITENIILKHDEAMIAPLRELRNLGVGIAFDDYGTGYASLSLLKRFPLSRLKIDQSFVRSLGSDPRDAAVVQAVVKLATEFGFDVVAEGIEVEEQEAALLGLGCRKGQGYLYGRPMPADQMLELFAKKSAVNENSETAVAAFG